MGEASVGRPSGWVPVVMSLVALAIVVIHAMRYGIVHEADEGTSAHLFQILMVAQVPVIGWFAVRWLPRERGRSLRVMAVQAVAIAAAFAAVYFLT